MPDLAEQVLAALPASPTMRDINDACVKFGLPSLAQGMIELSPPDALKQCVQEVVLENVHTYRMRIGEPEYLDAMATLLEKHYGTPLPEGAVVTPGAPHPLRANVFATLGVSGGLVATFLTSRPRTRAARVAILEPFYTYHLYQLTAALGDNVELIAVPFARAAATTDSAAPFAVDFDALDRVLATGVDLVVLCNPANPTGTTFPKTIMSRIIDAVGAAKPPAGHDSPASAVVSSPLLLVDECYCDLVWPAAVLAPVESDAAYAATAGAAAVSTVRAVTTNADTFWSPTLLGAAIPPHVVVARGFSKVLGCQSWRVGYAVANAALVPKLVASADPLYLCAPFLQHAVARFVTKYPTAFGEHASAVGGLMQRNLRLLVPAFEKAFGWRCVTPDGSMYAVFEHGQVSDDAAVRQALRAGVGVCPGSIFYLPSTLAALAAASEGGVVNTGLVRIHVGVCSAKADSVAERLAAAADGK